MKDMKHHKKAARHISHTDHREDGGETTHNAMSGLLKTKWYSPNIFKDEIEQMGLKRSEMRGMVEVKTHDSSDKVKW